MASILLTYGWVRSSYSALRNLCSHGVPVYVSDSKAIGMCQWSRFKKGFDLYSSHYKDGDAFLESIVKICKTRRVSLILASHNETEILAQKRDHLPQGTDRLLPNAEHTALFNDKSRSHAFAKSAGVPTPISVRYNTLDDLSGRIEEQGLRRCVVKLRTGNSAKGVFYAEDARSAATLVQDLIAKYQLPTSRFPQVEEYVRGEGWGCSVLYWHGQHIASFVHRRLREKISTGGTSTLREAAVNVTLERSARAIFDSIGWHGLAMCEFKVCPSTGLHWFIEVNPRLWGSLPLAVSAGVEFPYLAWLCAMEGPEAALNYHSHASIRSGWRSRWLLGDLTVALGEALSGKLGKAYQTMFQSGANSVDDFSWDDPLVFPGEVAAYLSNAIRGGSLNPSERGMLG